MNLMNHSRMPWCLSGLFLMLQYGNRVCQTSDQGYWPKMRFTNDRFFFYLCHQLIYNRVSMIGTRRPKPMEYTYTRRVRSNVLVLQGNLTYLQPSKVP